MTEKYFRAVIENTGDGVAIMNKEGYPLYIFPSIKNILGYTVEEGMDLNMLAVSHPDDIDKLNDIIGRLTGQPGVSLKSKPARIMHKDGSWRWIEGVFTNMLHDPEINGIVFNYRDITEAVAADNIIKDSEEKYRSFFENDTDGILILVTDGHILAANAAACRMFQKTEEEICSAGKLALIDPTDERIHQIVEARKKYGKVKGEVKLLRKDGSSFPGEISSTVFRDSNGELRTSMIIRDLTETKKNQQVLSELQANLQSILDNTSEGFILTDREGNIRSYNSRAKELVFQNVNGNIDLGRSILDFISEDRKEVFRSMLAKVLAGESVAYDHSYIRAGGNVFWMNFTLIPVRNGGRIDGVCITGTDITDRKQAEATLKESELRYRRIVETAQEGIWLMDENDVTTFVNEKMCEILGYSRGEINGRKIGFFIEGEGKAEALDALTSKDGCKGTINVPFRTKNGTQIHTSIAVNRFKDDNGNYSGMLGMVSDITDKRKLEQLFDKASQMAVIGSFELDLDTKALFWSAITKKIHEVEQDFLPDLGTAINFYKEGISRDSILESVNRLINEGIPYDVELQIVTAKGNERWVRAIGEGDFTDGKCRTIWGSFQDIDKAKTAEIQILNAFKEKKVILESIGDAFIALDENWVVTYWNNHAEKVMKKKRADTLGKTLWEVFPKAVDSVFHTYYHKAIKENTVQRFEAFAPELQLWFEVSAYPADKGLSVYFKDVTERKLADIRLNELNRELHRNIKELATSNKDLEDFAYVASHDLQEPLRMVTGFLSQLEKKYAGFIDDKGKQYIHFAVDGAKRMQQIILDLIEFSKVARGTEKRVKIDINEIVENVLVLCKKQINDKKAVITYANLPEVSGYKTPVTQLFQNLVSNAIKYSKKDVQPLISITAEDKNTYWQFAVKDNGIGLAEEYFNKIFTIFQRLHNRNEYSGTGLGLAICKKIIDNMGERIWVESDGENGSSFYFTIAKGQDSPREKGSPLSGE